MFLLQEVKTKRHRREFLQLPVKLYGGSPNWIRPLDKDIESVFNPKTNKHFRNGEAIRWILLSPRGETVGRIAAFIDRSIANTYEQPTGSVGFFECINSQEAANTLFDAGRNWLRQRGMEAMDGPVNFGDRDRWWGLLIDGDYEPNYCMGYHHAYYRTLFESYGFRLYYQQFTYHRFVNAFDVNPMVWERAKRVSQNSAYTITTISKSNLPRFADDFMTIYNLAWARFKGVKKVTRVHALALLKTVKPIIDEKLMYFAYHNGQPVGFFIMLPELNQVVKHLNGKFGLIGKLRFMYLLKVKRVCNKALGLIFGIVPQHQGKGVESALVNEFAKNALRPGFQYKELELNWIGDFNPSMCKLAEQIGGKVRKTHAVFRFMFDRNKEVLPPCRVNC